MPKGRHENRSCISFETLKIYIIFVIILSITTYIYFLWKKQPVDRELHFFGQSVDQDYVGPNGYVFEGEKIVHIDLKGAPLKVSSYTQLFPLFKKLGATGVLIEYEDMFPYSNDLMNVSALNAYSMDDIRTINNLAKKSNLQIIPLVPTFGNMEFILKLKEFKHYREVPAYPQVICPRHEDTEKLIKSMIEQILKAHPDSQMLHIGAHEVNDIGRCSRCIDFMVTYSHTKHQLFLKHINNVVNIVKKLFPHIKILMWDDQFRSFSISELKRISFNAEVIPVVWSYTPKVYEELEYSMWKKYSKTFKNVWAASSFKGAAGNDVFEPYFVHHLLNQRGWLSVIEDYEYLVHFSGIIITGWQRYDHFGILCELLPVGIPTLAMSLRLILGYQNIPLSLEAPKLLDCYHNLDNSTSLVEHYKCNFIGNSIFRMVLQLRNLQSKFEAILNDFKVRGWVNSYNIKYSFSNPAHVQSIMRDMYKMRTDLDDLRDALKSSLFELYDRFTVEEWLDTYVTSFEERIRAVEKAGRKLLTRDFWPRRPLQMDKV